MATQRQKKLAKAIVENAAAKKPKNAGQLLESVGYAKNTAEAKPGEILEQAGVKEELANLGFTVEGADSVVKEILYKGKSEKTRLTAANLVYERLGAKAPDKTINLNATLSLENTEELQKLAKRISQEIKQSYVEGRSEPRPVEASSGA